jgi:hypothetical protein
MGRGVDFPQRNDFFGKPKDMTDNQCYSLPVSRIITYIPGPSDKDKAQPCMAHISCWELSEEEVAEVVRTGKVFVKISGTGCMPMSIHGKLPIYVNQSDISDIVLTEQQIQDMRKGV